MEKLYTVCCIGTSKLFLKMAGGRMYTPDSHPTPLAMSYRNHQKSLACLGTWHH